jgi:hypothetical protein
VDDLPVIPVHRFSRFRSQRNSFDNPLGRRRRPRLLQLKRMQIRLLSPPPRHRVTTRQLRAERHPGSAPR